MEPNSQNPVPLHTAGSAWLVVIAREYYYMPPEHPANWEDLGLLNNATTQIDSSHYALVSLSIENLASSCYNCWELRQPLSGHLY